MTARGLMFLILLCSGITYSAQSQELPIPHPDDNTAEMSARLAFGLTPEGTFDFYASGQYRDGIPTPEQVFGYPIGSWHTTYGRMERYIEMVQEAAGDRVRIYTYGRSVEHQNMHLVIISSEANMARLDDIRNNLNRLADPENTTEAEATQIAAENPVMVWLNAANDGNETAAFEAVIQLVYQLAAGEDERTRSLRDGAVTILNMAHNPESHERHVAWYNAFVMGDSDPDAIEHRAPWGMSTNNNHYQIDLNRDALGLTQTETRAVATELQRWRPQTFVDLHGQTTQYFFPPAAIPVNPIYPAQMEKWLDIIGRGNAAAFDKHGWSYFTRDVFDLHYPGYWDTYPALHGATGMTYETDGGGSKGVRWRRDDGTILSFADGIAHHFVASLATIESTARNGQDRLMDYYRYFAGALAEAQRDPVKQVFLTPGNDSRKTASLATLMLRHGVRVQQVTTEAVVTGFDYINGQSGRRTIPAGSFVIPMAQPNYRIARMLLGRSVDLPEGFVRQELARLARNMRRAPGDRERHAFYDITAWSLPLATGVTAYWTERNAPIQSNPLSLSDDMVKPPGGWGTDTHLPVSGSTSGRAGSAYVWRPDSEGAIRLLARLLDEGFNVAVVSRPMMVGDRPYPVGSLFARVARNAPDLHERISDLALETGVTVYAADTAFPETGPTGTGSNATRTLKAPRVGIMAGDGVSITSFGALWFHMERRISYPFTALRTTDMNRIDLDVFDVLIFPNGSYGILSENHRKDIRSWVERGGTLIGYQGGARFLMGADMGTSHIKADTTTPPADSLKAMIAMIDRLAEATDLPPIESPAARPHDPMSVPGAFLRARLDKTHWLTFGYESSDLPLLTRSLPLRLTERGANPVVFAQSGNLVISGFQWPHNTTKTYAGKPYATVDRVGSGKVILLADDPLFRIAFSGPSRLLVNAIFLGARGLR